MSDGEPSSIKRVYSCVAENPTRLYAKKIERRGDMRRALYTKWRPSSFSDVVGQQAVVDTLLNQLKNNRVFHAYIFTGIRGTGKTTFARLLAKAVNCEHRVGGEPCNKCETCVGIDSGSLLDVTEIDAASNNGVDNIRDLRDETAFSPAVCSTRVYIIDEAHMLSASAWAALLKIMEEPPEHVMFILATTEIHKVPTTILSRCQRFDLKRISSAEIEKHILEIAKSEDIKLSDDAAALIARLADGAMRDALSLLDTCSSDSGEVTDEVVRRLAGVSDRDSLFDAAGYLINRDIGGILETVNALYMNSLDPSRLCFMLVRHFRYLMLARLDSAMLDDECAAGDAKMYRVQASSTDDARIIEIIKGLNGAIESMPKSSDKRLALEVALISLCAGTSHAPVAEKKAQPAIQEKRAEKVEKAEAQTAPADTAPKKEKSPPPSPADFGEAVRGPSPFDSDDIPDKAVKAAVVPDGLNKFEKWVDVLAALRPKSAMLFGALDGSSAYVTDTHLLIDAGETFYSCMRSDEATKELLKKTIKDVTGCSLPIGPLPKGKEKDEAAERVDKLIKKAAELGVPTDIIGG